MGNAHQGVPRLVCHLWNQTSNSRWIISLLTTTCGLSTNLLSVLWMFSPFSAGMTPGWAVDSAWSPWGHAELYYWLWEGAGGCTVLGQAKTAVPMNSLCVALHRAAVGEHYGRSLGGWILPGSLWLHQSSLLLMRKDLLFSPALVAILTSDLDLHLSPKTRNLGVILLWAVCFYSSLLYLNLTLSIFFTLTGFWLKLTLCWLNIYIYFFLNQLFVSN